MIHAYEPDYTTSFPLQDLSEDLFLEAAVKPENHSPVQAYDTLYCLSQVSQALKLRVDKCWIDFLQRLGKKTADFPDIDFKNPSPESLEKARKIVFQRAIDWMYVNPEVTQQIIPWLDSTCTANCFTNNFKAYPELWISNEWGDSLKCIDLMTQRIETFKLPEKVNPSLATGA